MKSLIFLATLFISQLSYAVYVEPSFGVGISSISGKIDDSRYFDSSVNPAVFGMRIGYKRSLFSLGLQMDYYLNSGWDMEDRGSLETKTSRFSGNNMGIFASFEFPVMVRASVAYLIEAEREGKSGEFRDEKLEGHGFALSASYTGFPMVEVGLDYRKMNYSEYVLATGRKVRSSLKGSEVVLKASLPLDF